jgi:predicted DNA-binding WGR domain protein
MSILIETSYQAHEEGTKYYEAISFWNEDRKRGVLVRRWGKMAQMLRGGEVKIESFTDVRSLHAAMGKIVSSKSQRGYNVSSANFGLHNVLPKQDPSSSEFTTCINKHYGADAIRIMMNLGLSSDDVAISPITDKPNFIVEEVPAEEPVRSEEWGSW